MMIRRTASSKVSLSRDRTFPYFGPTFCATCEEATAMLRLLLFMLCGRHHYHVVMKSYFFLYSFDHLVNQSTLGRPSICLSIHSFIHSLIHSFIYSFICLYINLFIHSLTHSFIHSLTHSFIHSFTHSFLSLIHI